MRNTDLGDAARALAGMPLELRRSVTERLDSAWHLAGVERVIIYGSYAKGTNGLDSDLDVAVFFRQDGRGMLEKHRSLQHICLSPDIDIQIQAFSSGELCDPCGIIEEIIMYGVDYLPSQREVCTVA